MSKAILKNSVRFYKILFGLITSSSFWTITLFGNLIIILFSYTFFYLESDINSNIHNFLDAIWWGFSTATTVGYGDIIPVTPLGKILGILLMLTGTALFATYTAIFAQSIIEDDILKLGLFKKETIPEDQFLDQLKMHKKLINEQIKYLESKD